MFKGAKTEPDFDWSNRDSGPAVEKSLLEAAEAVTRADLASTRMEDRSPSCRMMIAAIM
jgi:hypothetical protein